jgi:hypothetical protein
MLKSPTHRGTASIFTSVHQQLGSDSGAQRAYRRFHVFDPRAGARGQVSE